MIVFRETGVVYRITFNLVIFFSLLFYLFILFFIRQMECNIEKLDHF